MSFQVGIDSLGGTVFSGGTLHLSAKYVNSVKNVAWKLLPDPF